MQLSLFSVSYAGFWGQATLSLGDFIAKAAETGFDAVMLAGKRPHVSPLDAMDVWLASINHALEKNGVKCGVLAAYTNLTPGPAADIPQLEMQIAYVLPHPRRRRNGEPGRIRAALRGVDARARIRIGEADRPRISSYASR